MAQLGAGVEVSSLKTIEKLFAEKPTQDLVPSSLGLLQEDREYEQSPSTPESRALALAQVQQKSPSGISWNQYSPPAEQGYGTATG
eukprot:5492523-Amphidinium_carterae.1